MAIEWGGSLRYQMAPSLGATQSSASLSDLSASRDRIQGARDFCLPVEEGGPAVLQAKLGTCSRPSELLGAKGGLAAPVTLYVHSYLLSPLQCISSPLSSASPLSSQCISSSFLHSRRVLAAAVALGQHSVCSWSLCSTHMSPPSGSLLPESTSAVAVRVSAREPPAQV